MSVENLDPTADLPVLALPLAPEAVVRERADAARNRARILRVASKLFDARGIDSVSMDEIAEAASVGKGTLFRRFGDRANLARAVISEREADFQDRFIRGEPPLGPGAPPVERLVAFGRGQLGLVDLHGEVLRAAESGAPFLRFRAEPYAVYRLHVSLLLSEATPDLDAEVTADALLSTLSPELVLYQRRVLELSLERIGDGFERLVRALCGRTSAGAER